MYEVLDGEAIVLDSSTGTCFRLNPTATRAWELIVEHGELAAVRRGMLDDFEVAPSALDRDLLALFGDLEATGLVVVHREGPAED